LPKTSRKYFNRAYPDPVLLVESIRDPIHRLQASLQYEGGLRAEGVGAPDHKRFKNPLTIESLRGIGPDPVTGEACGYVASVEKGGKETVHYISVSTYNQLKNYIQIYGKLESDYASYVESINLAARATGQHSTGRGSHALKHNFAQRRYQECVAFKMSHEEALQQTSLETSHFRMSETITYTRGPRK
jgi:integrase